MNPKRRRRLQRPRLPDHHIDARRRGDTPQVAQKSRHRRYASLNFDAHLAGAVDDPAAQGKFGRAAIDIGTQSHALHVTPANQTQPTDALMHRANQRISMDRSIR